MAKSKMLSAAVEPLHIIALISFMFFGVLFARSIGYLGVVTGIELFYFLIFANSAFYARRLQIKSVKFDKLIEASALQNQVSVLRKDERRRYHSIEKIFLELESALQGQPIEYSSVSKESLLDLSDLRKRSVDLLILIQEGKQHLASNPIEKLQDELNSRLVDNNPSNESIQAIKLVEKRIEKLNDITQNLKVLDTQVSVIEHSLNYARENLHTIGTQHKLSIDIPAIINDIENHSAVINEMNTLRQM